MTKDEWLKVQNLMSSPYGMVRLTADGYALEDDVMVGRKNWKRRSNAPKLTPLHPV